MPRQEALLACVLFAVLAGALPLAARAAVSAERQAVLAARDRKAAEARESGYWIVARGEHLRLIAQQFFHGDHAAQARLRKDLLALNPRAFVHGDPDRLVPGARLELPPYVLAKGAARAAAATASPAQPSPITPSAKPPIVTQVPSAEFAPGPPAPPKKAAPAPYVDQLIEGGVAAESEEEAAGEAGLVPGQRYVSAEYRAEAHDPPGGGHGLEQGVQLQLRRETLDYGDLFLDAAVRDTRLPPGERSVSRRDGGRFTLYQQHFPVVQGWLADSALGVVRTPVSFLTSSYRMSLPTSLFGGASSAISDGRHTFTAYGGAIGRLEGTAVQSFDRTSGSVAGLGYDVRNGFWTAGGQAIRTAGSSFVADHEAATLAVDYANPLTRTHGKGQLVYDSGGHLSGWFDADVGWGRTRHRFGVYDLDPELKWGDTPMGGDQRGAYWRSDYRTLRYSVSGGLEGFETNLRDDRSRPATRSGVAYGTFSLRIDRHLDVGGGITYQGTRTRYSTSPRGSTVSGNAYAAWTGPVGLSRLDLTGSSATATGQPDSTASSLSWSQEWPALGPVNVSSTLAFSREDQAGVRRNRATGGISARGLFENGAQWDASVVYGRVDTSGVVEDNVNWTADASWPIARHWLAFAQAYINNFEAAPIVPGSDVVPAQRDKRFMLGVRYEESSGVPYQALGVPGGRGTGRLAGVVFFDENGDGVRQATERPAANVTVYLDGRYPATTDAQGRFAYPLVAPGTHGLRILNEALPLPWTVDDEHPLVADVPLRGQADIEIPLRKLHP